MTTRTDPDSLRTIARNLRQFWAEFVNTPSLSRDLAHDKEINELLDGDAKALEDVARRIEARIRGETERCAVLCEARADISRDSARELRQKGTFSNRSLWPPFRKNFYVLPGYEKAAADLDGVADAFDFVAKAIREGRTVKKKFRRGKQEVGT